MNLTSQAPMQYCSLQHQTLLLSPVTPTTGATVASSPSPSKSLWQKQNQNPAIKDGDQNKDRVEKQETVYEIAGIQYPDAEIALILFCSAP